MGFNEGLIRDGEPSSRIFLYNSGPGTIRRNVDTGIELHQLEILTAFLLRVSQGEELLKN